MAGLAAHKRPGREKLVRRWAVVERLCERVAAGESPADVFRDPTMPPRPTVMYWIETMPELEAMYDAARAACPEGLRPYHRYSEKAVEAVMARIEAGRGIWEVCAEREMPAATTMFRWMKERPEVEERYRQAKANQADRLFDLAWRIACEADEDSVKTARLRIDTIKWRVARLAPRAYGPWKAQAAPADPGGEPSGDGKAQTPRLLIEVRQFANTPDRKVVEITRLVRGKTPDEIKALREDIAAGRLLAPPPLDGAAN